MNSNEELQALWDDIKEAARNNFIGHPRFHEWSESTPTAMLFLYPRPDEGARAVVKLYQRNKGGDILYCQEFLALHRLWGTRRVCRVLTYSMNHNVRYRDENGSGPYFIVKEYYPRSLKDALNNPNWFESLDIAAQQADISLRFMAEGWRDYDGRVVNDAICDDGRLIRLDLDAALPLSIFNEEGKLNVNDRTCFYIKEGDFIKAAVRRDAENVKLFTSYEVTNLAIRIAHMFVGRDRQTEFTKLLGEMQEAVSALQKHEGDEKAPAAPAPAPPEGDEAAKQESDEPADGPSARKVERAGNFIRKLPRTLLNFYKPRPGALEPTDEAEGVAAAQATEPAHPGPAAAPPPSGNSADGQAVSPSSLGRWLEMWHTGRLAEVTIQDIKNTPGRATFFTTIEYELLARLTHHLIVEPEHGFTLQDLKSSLLMLNAAFLKDREDVIRKLERSEGSWLLNFSPNTRLYSLSQAVAPHASPDSSPATADGEGGLARDDADETTGDDAGETQQFTIKAEIKAARSGSWKAQHKDESEDRAFAYPAEGLDHLAFVAVADGATTGGGLAAARIIEKEIRARAPHLKPSSPDEASSDLRKMVVDINGLLMEEAGKSGGEPHQAMLVMALVTVTDDSCFVTVAHAGDSHCLIIFPGSEELVLNTRKYETKRLGEVESLSEKHFRVDTLDLGSSGKRRPGLYRIRLFSDGVREKGIDRIRHPEESGIEALVAEAKDWPEKLHGNIGTDDWSVAGIDVNLEAVPVSSLTTQQAGGDKATSQAGDEAPAPMLSDIIAAFDRDMFPLSGTAAKFWRRAVAPLKGRSRLQLIKDVVGEDELEAEEDKLVVKHAPPREKEETKKAETPAEPPRRDLAGGKIFEAAGRDHAPSEQDYSRRVAWTIIIVVLMCSASAAFLISRAVSRSDSENDNTNRPRPTPTSTPAPVRTPAPGTTKNIGGDLSAKGYLLRGEFAAGTEIDEKIKQFLDALAEELKAKKYRVNIFIFAREDEPGQKQDITRTRAQKVADYLREKHQGVMEDYVSSLVGGGRPHGGNLPRGSSAELKRQLESAGQQGASIFVMRLN